MSTTDNRRLQALDWLRGLTVAGMILVNNGYGESFSMLRHSRWNGLTPCDLVFPFFLFIMGVSCYLSMAKTQFRPSAGVLRKVVRRTVLLFALGLFINWADHAVEGDLLCFGHLRLWAVLQRIALSYLFVSLFALYCPHRWLVPAVAGLLAAYAAILVLGHGYAENASQNILARVDLSLFGADHLYHKSPVDPEGLVGTVSSVAHVLIGFFCGRLLKQDNRLARLFAVGTLCLFAGWLLSYALPLNKRVWSPSYVLVTCGLCALLLGLFIHAELTGGRRAARSFRPLTVFGVNALALYVVSELMAILFGHFGVSTALYDLFHTLIASPPWASLAYALTFVALNGLVGLVLWKRKIFIKL